MATNLPGTTIEVSGIAKGCSRIMFEGIFAAGGITLSQVSVMTGLEPYMIQNWVKRGFVSSPVNRQYTKSQFARIVNINMLRESLPLDSICSLLSYINGDLKDQSDDLIDDSELYHKYVDMLSDINSITIDEKTVISAAETAAEDYSEPVQGARQRLSKILQVMAYAHFASICRSTAEKKLLSLE
ncbi:MAG: DUF1836 domain-containing protein [Ruminococcaceae bacterium]|nr:DUF1836 domain-containing protein [Oscillospiraceae bacterium]